MTAGELAAVAGGVVVAVAMWVVMFRLDRSNIWPRTWMAAAAVSGYAIVAASALGNARDLLGRISAVEVAVGITVGGAWLVTTHVGAAVLGRIVPSFLEEITDLYRLADGDSATRIVGPLIAMAVAEELLFRGLIQAQAGLLVAVGIYAAIQLVEGKAALIVAAAFGGLVWGGLFAWRDGLVAPIVAHAVWTVALTLVWPLHTERVA